MSALRTVSTAFAIAAASLANATPTPIDPFIGTVTEGFENLDPPGGYPVPYSILEGHATTGDLLANTFVIATSVSSVDTDWVTFFPDSGFLMGLVPTGWAYIEFETPVTHFGMMVGSAAIHEGGWIEFFDQNGVQFDSRPITINELVWEWHGWSSTTPIGRIDIRGNSFPGKPLVFDDMQIIPVSAECLGDIADDFGFTAADGGGPDGSVDFGDFVALLGLIGPCDGGTPGCLGDIADDFGFTVADGGGPDGTVDFGDFVALLGLIGPCP